MPVKKVLSGNMAVFICPDCAKEFESEYKITPEDEDLLKMAYNCMICNQCAKERAKKKEMERLAEEAERKSKAVDEAMKEAGFTGIFHKLEKPLVRTSAEWIYRNRHKSLLISGETGTGKTSGAAFVARFMLQNDSTELSFCYRTWQMLMAEYLEAKTSGGDNELRFWNRVDHLDYLIVDELVGRRGDSVKLTPSGHELLFNLVDGVYAGFRKTKVWIIGNFYDGAIDRMMDDPTPTKRRIQERFKIAWFEEGKPVDESIKIFNKQTGE